MRRFWIGLIGFSLLLAGTANRAAAEMKIGVVDLQKAMELSEEGGKAKALFQKKVERIQKDLKAKQDELAKLKEDLERQSVLLSEEARLEKQSSYQNSLKEFKRLYEDAQDELRREDAKLSERIIKELRKVIDGYGKKEGFDLILEKNQSAVLYRSSKLDITSDIIKLYNESKRGK